MLRHKWGDANFSLDCHAISLRNSFVIEFIYHFKSPFNFVIAIVYFVDREKTMQPLNRGLSCNIV